MKYSSLLILGLLLMTNASYAQIDKKANRILKSIHKEFAQGVSEHDVEKVVSFYDENARFLPMVGGFRLGKEEIRQQWLTSFSYNVVEFRQEILSSSKQGDVITEVGITHAKFENDGNLVGRKFKYSNVWVRQPDRSYKLKVGIYNMLKEQDS